MGLGKDVLAAKLSASEARTGRLWWSGGVANGAVLLALIGLIGNVPDPDAALSFLTPAITAFVVGIGAGAYAAYVYAQVGGVEVIAATDAAFLESVQPYLTTRKSDELRMSLALLEGRNSDQLLPPPPDDRQARIRLERAVTELSHRAALSQAEKELLARRIGLSTLASIACLALGIGAVLIPHVAGLRLQSPAAAKEAPVTVVNNCAPAPNLAAKDTAEDKAALPQVQGAGTSGIRTEPKSP